MGNNFEFLLYQSAEENVSVNSIISDETIWLTQKSMAELFGVTPQNITQHLKNIYAENELDEKSTCKNFLQVPKRLKI